MSNSKIEYIQTKSGMTTVMINGYLLHSKYDPKREAEKIAEKEVDYQFTHILFGYGNGYIAEALANRLNKKQLIVYEPEKSILPILTTLDNFIVLNNLKDLEHHINEKVKNYDTKIKVICSPNYNKIFEEEYEKVLKLVKDMQYENIVNQNTIHFFSEMWQENYIRNLMALGKGATLIELKNRYTCPVVLASGGPSLTKQLPQLKKIANKVIIIAAGSTINSLLAADIEPDYVVSIDGGDANYQHFKNINTGKTKLIYSMSSHYKIQEEFRGNMYGFLFSGEQETQQHIEKGVDVQLPLVYGGGTVANSALHIATYISSGPVALIGQDLAYTNNQSHADNNKFYSEINENFLMKKKAFKVEGYYGDKVYTDYSFHSMRKTFEKIYKLLNDKYSIYNCTEGGSKIEGVPQKSFLSFCEEHVDDYEYKIMQELYTNKKNILDKLHCFLVSEINNYNSLEEQLQKALNILGENKSELKFSSSILKKLDKIDVKVKGLYKSIMMDRIVDPITMEVMRNFQPPKEETPALAYQRVYEQNITLYSKLLSAVQKSRDYTRTTLAKIQYKEVLVDDRTTGSTSKL
ncbi:motility associated factor glycosyltransferase family protein [Solibacillus silvestris]|uniref:motility associated factor glycosyltransferase family protein n=1 Tax=Solibacillus silvestris TaxID=76853 RepID=UPI003F821F69